MPVTTPDGPPPRASPGAGARTAASTPRRSSTQLRSEASSTPDRWLMRTGSGGRSRESCGLEPTTQGAPGTCRAHGAKRGSDSHTDVIPRETGQMQESHLDYSHPVSGSSTKQDRTAHGSSGDPGTVARGYLGRPAGEHLGTWGRWRVSTWYLGTVTGLEAHVVTRSPALTPPGAVPSSSAMRTSFKRCLSVGGPPPHKPLVVTASPSKCRSDCSRR